MGAHPIRVRESAGGGGMWGFLNQEERARGERVGGGGGERDEG